MEICSLPPGKKIFFKFHALCLKKKKREILCRVKLFYMESLEEIKEALLLWQNCFPFNEPPQSHNINPVNKDVKSEIGLLRPDPRHQVCQLAEE